MSTSFLMRMCTKFNMLASVSALDRLNFVLRKHAVKQRERAECGRQRSGSIPVKHLHVALDFGLRHRFFNQRFDWRPFGSAPATAFTMSAAQ